MKLKTGCSFSVFSFPFSAVSSIFYKFQKSPLSMSLQGLTGLYQLYLEQNNNKSPQNATQFRNFCKKQGLSVSFMDARTFLKTSNNSDIQSVHHELKPSPNRTTELTAKWNQVSYLSPTKGKNGNTLSVDCPPSCETVCDIGGDENINKKSTRQCRKSIEIARRSRKQLSNLKQHKQDVEWMKSKLMKSKLNQFQSSSNVNNNIYSNSNSNSAMILESTDIGQAMESRQTRKRSGAYVETPTSIHCFTPSDDYNPQVFTNGGMSIGGVPPTVIVGYGHEPVGMDTQLQLDTRKPKHKPKPKVLKPKGNYNYNGKLSKHDPTLGRPLPPLVTSIDSKNCKDKRIAIKKEKEEEKKIERSSNWLHKNISETSPAQSIQCAQRINVKKTWTDNRQGSIESFNHELEKEKLERITRPRNANTRPLPPRPRKAMNDDITKLAPFSQKQAKFQTGIQVARPLRLPIGDGKGVVIPPKPRSSPAAVTEKLIIKSKEQGNTNNNNNNNNNNTRSYQLQPKKYEKYEKEIKYVDMAEQNEKRQEKSSYSCGAGIDASLAEQHGFIAWVPQKYIDFVLKNDSGDENKYKYKYKSQLRLRPPEAPLSPQADNMMEKRDISKQREKYQCGWIQSASGMFKFKMCDIINYKDNDRNIMMNVNNNCNDDDSYNYNSNRDDNKTGIDTINNSNVTQLFRNQPVLFCTRGDKRAVNIRLQRHVETVPLKDNSLITDAKKLQLAMSSELNSNEYWTSFGSNNSNKYGRSNSNDTHNKYNNPIYYNNEKYQVLSPAIRSFNHQNSQYFMKNCLFFDCNNYNIPLKNVFWVPEVTELIKSRKCTSYSMKTSYSKLIESVSDDMTIVDEMIKECLIALCGFVNSKGGTFYGGITDKYEIAQEYHWRELKNEWDGQTWSLSMMQRQYGSDISFNSKRNLNSNNSSNDNNNNRNIHKNSQYSNCSHKSAGGTNNSDDKLKQMSFKYVLGLKLTNYQMWYATNKITNGIKSFEIAIDNYCNLKHEDAKLESKYKFQKMEKFELSNNLSMTSVTNVYNRWKEKGKRKRKGKSQEKSEKQQLNDANDNDNNDNNNNLDEKEQEEKEDYRLNCQPSAFCVTFIPMIKGNGEILENKYILKASIMPPIVNDNDTKESIQFICFDGRIYQKQMNRIVSKTPDEKYYALYKNFNANDIE